MNLLERLYNISCVLLDFPHEETFSFYNMIYSEELLEEDGIIHEGMFLQWIREERRFRPGNIFCIDESSFVSLEETIHYLCLESCTYEDVVFAYYVHQIKEDIYDNARAISYCD